MHFMSLAHCRFCFIIINNIIIILIGKREDIIETKKKMGAKETTLMYTWGKGSPKACSKEEGESET